MKWKTWLKGLAGAIVGGVATSITLCIVDPMTYNINDGLGRLGQVALVSAIFNAAFYLKKSPTP